MMAKLSLYLHSTVTSRNRHGLRFLSWCLSLKKWRTCMRSAKCVEPMLLSHSNMTNKCNLRIKMLPLEELKFTCLCVVNASMRKQSNRICSTNSWTKALPVLRSWKKIHQCLHKIVSFPIRLHKILKMDQMKSLIIPKTKYKILVLKLRIKTVKKLAWQLEKKKCNT